MFNRSLAVLAVAVVTVCFAGVVQAQVPAKPQPANGKVKIFVLSGQSNMVGMGEVHGGKGTLDDLVKSKPQVFAKLVDAQGKPLVRNDVWVVNISYKQQQGWLSVGYGAKETCIGPEYGFGQVMGDYYKDPVVLIKCAWGGRSLYKNFLPPSSEAYPPPQKDGDTGFQYAETIREVKEITANLKKYFPDYNGKGYEIVGFGWHQGWNDRIDQKAVDAYEVNLTHLIADLRKDLGIPNMPFVVANTGMGGWEASKDKKSGARVTKLMEAQLAVGNPEKHPEFKGTVAGVETRDFQRSQEESPSKQSYHWLRNFETYYLIGEAMGKAMVSLVDSGTPQH